MNGQQLQAAYKKAIEGWESNLKKVDRLTAELAVFRETERAARDRQHEAENDVRFLRAELAASESLVTALQEQMARLAEQHAKAVAEAREETRETIAQRHESRKTWNPENAEAEARFVRATPLDSTPLAARIAELEKEREHSGRMAIANASSLAAGVDRERSIARAHLVNTLEDVESLRHQRDEACAALAAEVERHQATAKERDEFLKLLATNCGCEDDPNPCANCERIDEYLMKHLALASLPAGPREDR